MNPARDGASRRQGASYCDFRPAGNDGSAVLARTVGADHIPPGVGLGLPPANA
jgi:hypothetical protein